MICPDLSCIRYTPGSSGRLNALSFSSSNVISVKKSCLKAIFEAAFHPILENFLHEHFGQRFDGFLFVGTFRDDAHARPLRDAHGQHAKKTLGIDFPVIVDKTVNSVAQMATPLALITIGAGFEGRKALAKIRPTIAASMIKLVVQPLIFLPVAAWMGFRGEQMIAILIMLASPTTPSCYIMAKNMDNDGVLTASVIVMTTLLAAFTLTGWIFILKTVGLIG